MISRDYISRLRIMNPRSICRGEPQSPRVLKKGRVLGALCAALLAAAPAPASALESTGPASTAEAPLSPVRMRAPIMAGIGATLALSGTVLWISGGVQQSSLVSRGGNPTEYQSAQRTAQQTQLGGMGLTLLGACALGVSLVMWNWAPEQPKAVSTAVMIAPGRGGVSLAGTFP